MDYDVIIVGAGIAGMTAAIYVRRANKTVLVIENKAYGGQIISTLKVSNWPGEQEISGADLSRRIYHQMNNFGAELKYEDVVSIEVDGDKNGFLVKTDENEYSCGAIILAVGTEPRKLSKKQAEDAGKRPISYCATCDGALYKGKPVVVVGSGNTAKYEMQYLSSIASKVYHIHHDDPIPKDAEAVFVAIGRVPNTRFLKGVGNLIIMGLKPKWRRRFHTVMKESRKKILRPLISSCSVSLVKDFTYRAALTAAPSVALASATSDSTEPIAIFFMGIILTLIWPKFGREKLNKKTVLVHLIATVLVVTGVILIQI